jgi:two-component system response regulator MprA
MTIGRHPAEETLGMLFRRVAAQAGYDGRAASAYVTGRLGGEAPMALAHEPVPSDWAACEALAGRHGVAVALLWNLVVEDRLTDQVRPATAPAPRRVLVVEDDDATRAMLADVLIGEGYEVRAAASAPEGLTAVVAWRPAVIVLDLVLPAVDGRAFAQAVRADTGLRRAPILLVSAARAGDLATAAARVGAAAHLPKPLVVEEFLATVAQLAGLAPDPAAR